MVRPAGPTDAPYSPFTYNVECLVPWRTLTGRQHFYLDHTGYLEFGEHLPTYKPKPLPTQYADMRFTEEGGDTMMLNYLTPHGKWHIHSTYGDNERMTTLSRGVEPFWMNDKDAGSGRSWTTTGWRSSTITGWWSPGGGECPDPAGICISITRRSGRIRCRSRPKRGYRRAGGHNSLTRTRLKPTLMIGGYGQFTYHFNYWGPTGVNRDTHILVRKCPGLEVVRQGHSVVMNVRSQISMVFHLDKCIGCHTCSIACKNIWTDRKGTDYMWWNNVETKPGTGFPTQVGGSGEVQGWLGEEERLDQPEVHGQEADRC